MKKNININLFGTLYAIDEDACELLEDYLNNMKSYFAKREGGDEIADDIEHRVAEHLWALKEQGMNAIDLETVKRIIGSIGNPDEVDGSTNDDSAESAGDSTTSADDSATKTDDSATEKTAKERDAETDDKHRMVNMKYVWTLISATQNGLTACFTTSRRIASTATARTRSREA